jgi:hypothetical protein
LVVDRFARVHATVDDPGIGEADREREGFDIEPGPAREGGGDAIVDHLLLVVPPHGPEVVPATNEIEHPRAGRALPNQISSEQHEIFGRGLELAEQGAELVDAAVNVPNDIHIRQLPEIDLGV